jgi:hypothetical protein
LIRPVRVGSQSKKFDRRWAVERAENRCKRNALPLAGGFTQPSQQRFTPHNGRGLGDSRSIFLLRTRAGFVARTDRYNLLDPVRLALPRSPESGVAVSSRAFCLSRENRKISLIFWWHVYL